MKLKSRTQLCVDIIKYVLSNLNKNILTVHTSTLDLYFGKFCTFYCGLVCYDNV